MKTNPGGTKTAPKGVVGSSKGPQKDPLLYDLSADSDCKLCEKKNFKPGSDALLKHYALDHFKEKLEVDIGKDFSCNLCKTKKLKSKFENRQEFLLHNASVHFRAQHLLAEALGEKPSSGTSEHVSNNTRRTRNSERGKQRSEETSNDSVIEIESSSGGSDVSQNGLESDASDKSTDPEEEVEDEDDEDDVIEFLPSSNDENKSSSVAKGDKSSELETKKKELWVIDRKSKTKTETWFVNKECSKSSNPSDEVIEVIDLDDEDGEDSGNDTETESQDSDSKSASGGVAPRSLKDSSFPTPRNMEEFQQALKDNLCTKVREQYLVDNLDVKLSF